MPRSRLPSLAVIGALALASLALGHELIYLAAHGVGEGYDVAMREAGHDRYWTSFLLVVALVTSALVVVAATQLRRLRRLAAAVRSRSVRVGDVGFDRFLRLLGPLWLRLTASAIAAYVVQENVETASVGSPLPGSGVLSGEHWMALPVLLLVSLLVAAVGALVGWRREVILARLRAAARRRFRTAAATLGPAQSIARPRGVDAAGRNGVRAPPGGVLAPA